MASTAAAGLSTRTSPLEMDPDEFRRVGHRLVDTVADLLRTLPDRPVWPAEEPEVVRALLPRGGLPESGADAGALIDDTARLLIEHSLFNGHPRFWGFITASAAPIGVLADLLAAAVNPNLGGWALSPVATEIEVQTVRWIAELLGYPGRGGLLVSGGNMANMIGFWVGRRVKLPWDLRRDGLRAGPGSPRVYVSRETHTWVEKATDLSGMGTASIRWIPTDASLRIDMNALRAQIESDRAARDLPILVVGTAGSVSTGAIDPLPELAELCRDQDLWFHVDGAYGAPAAVLPNAPPELAGMREADSVAVDPHKWLYAPLEAGCVLVRDPEQLRDTFTFHPPYYPEQDRSEDGRTMFYEYGPQNSRGFRALKVWLALRHVGRAGYARMIGDDIELARALYDAVAAHPELEAVTLGLSIATFRYVPDRFDSGRAGALDYLDELNRVLLDRLQASGTAFVTNAVVEGRFLLRACIVNFRTTRADVEALAELVAALGRAVDAELRPDTLR